MTLFIQLTIGALSLAGLYALVAFGVQLVYGLTNLVNFAHGALMTLGSYLFVSLIGQTTRFHVHLNVWLALVITVLALCVVGYFTELIFFRRTLRVPVSGFIISLGLILILENLYSEVWRPFPITVDPPLRKRFNIGGAVIASSQLLALGCALVAMLGLVWWVSFSKYGRALRACAEDREMARLLGVPAQRMVSLAFTIGTGAAGLAGVLLAFQTPVSPALGTAFVINGFTVALVGGLGSIPGALVGALVVGAVNSYASGYLPTQWTVAYGLGLILVVLLIKPSGILGGRHGAKI